MNNGVVICHACPIRIRQERRVDVTSLEIQPSTCKDENEWKREFALFEMIRDGAHRLIVVRSLDSCQVNYQSRNLPAPGHPLVMLESRTVAVVSCLGGRCVPDWISR